MPRIEISKDWCLNMAEMEGGCEIGAGSPNHPLRATDLAADGSHIAIVATGMDAIAAAERGADLWHAGPDGWYRIPEDRRAWVISRAKNKRAKVAIDLFGSTSK